MLSEVHWRQNYKANKGLYNFLNWSVIVLFSIWSHFLRFLNGQRFHLLQRAFLFIASVAFISLRFIVAWCLFILHCWQNIQILNYFLMIISIGMLHYQTSFGIILSLDKLINSEFSAIEQDKSFCGRIKSFLWIDYLLFISE